MLYLIIEREQIDFLETQDGRRIPISSFLTITEPNGSMSIPVFLSKFTASKFYAANPTVREGFKVISVNSNELSNIKNAYDLTKDIEVIHYPCTLVVGLIDESNFCPRLFNRSFSMREVLMSPDTVESRVESVMQEKFHAEKAYEKLNDHEIAKEVAKAFDQKLTVQKVPDNKAEAVQEAVIPMGKAHGFVIISQDGVPYFKESEGVAQVMVFFNKLDAAITFLLELGENARGYQIKNVDDQSVSKNLEYFAKRRNALFFAVFGYCAVMTSIGPRWASTHPMHRIMSARALEIDFTEVKTGLDLDAYFLLIKDNEARRNARLAFDKTNAADMQVLIEPARNSIEDMSKNGILVAPDNPLIYHRIIFIA